MKAGAMPIVPVLLSGGTGTRLWPVSRASHPKQFIDLLGSETLFQAAARRFSHEMFSPPLVLTQTEYTASARTQLLASRIRNAKLLLEPAARNTAPAILAAALHLDQTMPNSLMVVAPSDHIIGDPSAFRDCIRAAIPAAEAGQLVTFGIRPTGPETGFGYLDLDRPFEHGKLAPIPLRRFVEKPSAERAQAMLEAGTYLWNAGIFLFTTKSIMRAFQDHAPHMVPLVEDALDTSRDEGDCLTFGAGAWSALPSISVDYAIMEHTANLCVVPFSGAWSDLGNWDAVRQASGSTPEDDVSTRGRATAIDCEASLLRSAPDGPQLLGIGLKDIIAVATPDAVLVAHKSRAQDVGKAALVMGAAAAYPNQTIARQISAWGWVETIARGTRYRVNHIHVHPGQLVSFPASPLQTKHWTVVSGTARLTLDTVIHCLRENQSAHIPPGVVPQLENTGQIPLALIETQTGNVSEPEDIAYADSQPIGNVS
tara:strand:+ start:10289 stop:11737 length:1449 start_codon:yes stop_codon:yes gene_type:complete